MSISPSRNERAGSKGAFTVKPTEINHFTGRRKTFDDQRHIDIEVQRERDGTGIKNLASRDKSKNNDDELYVQVGEHTQVFKYGDKGEEQPRLIDQYISYFKEGDDRRKTVSKVTQSLVRNRSHSEDAFFRGQERRKSLEKGVLHRGLIGAEGTAPAQTGEPEEREVLL